MNKKILLVLNSLMCCVLLSGCLYQEIDEIEVKKGYKACEDKEGLRVIEETFTGDTIFSCNDGTKISERTADKEQRRLKNDK
jgi:hypothetical protein